VYWSQTAMAIPFYIPVMLAFMFSIPILFQDLNLGVVGIPVMALVLGSFFMLSRFGVTSMRNRKAGKIDKLASDLSRIAYEGHMARSAVVVDGAVRSDERTEAPETRPADRKIPGLDESVSSEPPANEVGTAEGRSRRRQ
jgi:hypothetical protein